MRDVHAHLARTYASVTGDEVLAVTVALPATATEAACSVSLEVRETELGWLAVTSSIGSLRDLSGSDLLATNARTAIGSFCTRDGQLAIRQALPLGALRPLDLDETVRTLASEVVAMRARLRSLR